MFIFKNALRNILRSMGRNVLLGIIIVVIAASSCIAMSISNSADIAREKSKENLKIVANINIDRQYISKQTATVDMSDQETMESFIKEVSTITMDDLEKYSENDNVTKFYYTIQTVLDGDGDKFTPYEGATSSSSSSSSSSSTAATTAPTQSSNAGPGGEQAPQAPGGQQQQDPSSMMAKKGEFMLTGYSEKDAMTDFLDGVCTITDGTMFTENTTDYECVIESELADQNSVSVGDTIELQNPNDSKQSYKFTVKGIYKNSDSTQDITGATAADPANNILTSYEVANSIVEASSSDDSDDTELSSNLNGFYSFADMDGYDAFAEYVSKESDEKYVLTSNDVATFEASLTPLENLKTFAQTFLVIILIIGAIILMVLSMFNIRERKYEIGVLTAMGMTKLKVAAQFIVEIFIITLISIIIGTSIGAVASTPVSQNLLESQIQQEQESASQINSNFGETGKMTKGGDVKGDVTYVDDVTYSVDAKVILIMIGIGILLTLFSGQIAVISVMRYQPLKILTNRD